MSLTVYGHPASQPSRTVFWACLLGNLPFRLVSDPGVDLRASGINPRGQIPAIADGNFRLAEAAAIVWYLARKHGWPDLYPDDTVEQARVHQFAHMHHHLVRLATYHLMAPHVMKPLALPAREPNPLSLFQNDVVARAFAEDDPYVSGGAVVERIAGFLEANYFFDGSTFLCGGERATLADLIGYSELGQFRFANLFDFSPYPRLSRWLEAMQDVPHHDTVHAYNIALGDIRTSPNTLERFMAASAKGIEALAATGLMTAG